MQTRSGITLLLGLALGCGSANQHGKLPAAERADPPPAAPPSKPPPSTAANPATAADDTLRGEAALSDWTGNAPGVRRKLTLQDLPMPHATKSVNNQPDEVDPKEGALPRVPEGFQVARFATKPKRHACCEARRTETSSSRNPSRIVCVCCATPTAMDARS